MMAPGPIEETGKVAVSLIETMKSQPLTLAVLVFNLVVIVMVYFTGKEFRANADRITSALLTQNKEMVDMIARCIVPPPTL